MIQEIIQRLSQKRGKAGLLVENKPGEVDRLLLLEDVSNVEIVDLIDNLLVDIVQSSDSVLGAFREDGFHEWLTNRIGKKRVKEAFLCTHLDAWLATMKKPNARDFFAVFSEREYAVPVLLVTAQRSLVKQSKFPDEYWWDLSELEAE